MNLYNFDLLPILIALVIIICVVLWVAIRNYKNFILMFFLIPLALYSGWTVYSTVDKLLGYPTIDVFDKDTLYISHYENPDISEWIYIWVLKPTESKPKSIMIPNTKKNKEELAAAEQKKSNGVPVYLDMKQGQGQTSGGDLQHYTFQENWGNAAKEEQRQRDETEERVIPGPVTPPETGDRPTLNVDELQPPAFGGNDQIIWREDSKPTPTNPYDFDWADEGSETFLP